MSRIIHIIMVNMILIGFAGAVSAESWMFRRSYHSHEMPPEVAVQFPAPASRSAYRVPYVAAHYGMAVRGGYRYNHIWLRSGNSVDHTVLVEGFVDVIP